MGIIAISADKIIPNVYKTVTTCQEILHMYRWVTNPDSVASLYTRYPACVDLKTIGSNVHVLVNASLSKMFPEERAALLSIVFGVSGWITLVIHTLLLEVYLNYNMDEDERLKMVSAERRRSMGFEVNRGFKRSVRLD
jgi:hypothetical protein